MKKLIVSIFVCLFANALAVSAQGEPGVTVFQHANVIDGISSEPLRDVTVIVAN